MSKINNSEIILEKAKISCPYQSSITRKEEGIVGEFGSQLGPKIWSLVRSAKKWSSPTKLARIVAPIKEKKRLPSKRKKRRKNSERNNK
jgi:hypothetical protein